MQRQRPGSSPGFAADVLTCVETYVQPASSELGWAPLWGSGRKSHCYTRAWRLGLLACDSVGLCYIHSPGAGSVPLGLKIHRMLPLLRKSHLPLSASELTGHPGIAHFEALCNRQKKKIEGTVSA